MKVEINFTPERLAEIRQWMASEAADGFYTKNPQTTRVEEADSLPEWVTRASSSICVRVHAGAQEHAEGMFYSSCYGNWIAIRKDGTAILGGRRHAHRTILAGGNGVESWKYPEGGTQTPELAPWETTTR